MKKIYLSIIALTAGLAVNAQTLTQANNAPSVGDQYSTLQCDSLNMTPGASGAGAVWNFSAVTIHSNVVNNYTAVATTNTSYPTGANGGVQVASAINNQAYFLPSATDLKYYGGNISVQAYDATLIYTTPAIYGAYPMSLNTSSTSTTAGSISIASPPLSGTFTGSSMTKADGSGTLMLPGGAAGTFSNVLRVINTQTLNYNATVTGVVNLVIYNYYVPGVKAPMLTITSTTITTSFPPSTSTQSVITINKDYLAPITIGIRENKNALSDLSVYPNPAVGQLNFATENKTVKEALIYDVTGKLVEKQNFSDGKLNLDVSNYNNGFYLYSILNANGEILKTGKVAINR